MEAREREEVDRCAVEGREVGEGVVSQWALYLLHLQLQFRHFQR